MAKQFKVYIERSSGDYISSECDLDIITGIHYDNISGGVHRRQSGYSLYGYIPYSIGKDLVKCSGTHEYFNNDIKIKIIPVTDKSDPCYEGYKEAIRRSSNSKPASDRDTTLKPCTKRIREVLADHEGTIERIELRSLLTSEGYPVQRIAGAINNLVKNKIISKNGFGTNPHQKLTLL